MANVKWEPVQPKTDCFNKYCDAFIHVRPVSLPAIPLAKTWTSRPTFLPAKYAKMAEKIANFKVRPDDVWVIGYPKSGTTWTQEMTWLVSSNLDYETKLFVEERYVQLEGNCVYDLKERDNNTFLGSVEQADSLPSPRYIKTHLPIQLLPKEIWTVRPKIVYVARNPKDAAVSLFHHYRNFHFYEGDMSAFYRACLADKMYFAPSHKHVLNFWEARGEPNILFLTYEQMKSDMVSVLRKMMEFFGKSFSEEQLVQLSNHLHVDNMRHNPKANFVQMRDQVWAFLGDKPVDPDFTFIRKGVTGSHKSEMPADLISLFDTKAENIFKGTGLTFDV